MKEIKVLCFQALVKLVSAEELQARQEAIRELFCAALGLATQRGHGFDFSSLETYLEQSEEFAQEMRVHLETVARLAEADYILSRNNKGEQDEQLFQAAGIINAEQLTFPVSENRSKLRWVPGRGLVPQAGSQSVGDLLVEIFRDNSETHKLRSCRVCEKLFLAKRLDAKTCSPEHASLWRSRAYYQRAGSGDKKTPPQ
ncbi:hypothetical protein [Thioalkalivibrio thiocyanodenitrificans]|uniref:hypothetical protein n=1 Tax=Thioalkalivibrio thiocyanodenitrificans TaxID=243063 RepID=UPI000368E057|nr:hypothetical protein [Thioalkalivibrio thiocyanodenitrificans]